MRGLTHLIVCLGLPGLIWAQAPTPGAAKTPAPAATKAERKPSRAEPASAPERATKPGADQQAEARLTEPVVLHTPINQARADRAFDVIVEVQNEGLLADLSLIVRAADGSTHVMPFERAGPTAFQVTVPARLTGGRTLGYAIVSTDRQGVERRHFAALNALHLVDLRGIGESAKMRMQLARYDGKRNQIKAVAEYVSFGAYDTLDENFDSVTVDKGSDAWQHYTAEWTYRPLTWLHDIRVRAGYMRASAVEVNGARLRRGDAPGVNYGSAEANVELHRWFSIGGRFVLGANEEGFVTGIGFVGRVGDMAKTHLAVDFEAIQDVGSRTDLRLHWTTLPRFPMALGVTFTDWPDARAETANMLTYDLGLRVGEAGLLGLRVGAANRPASLNTGYSAGATFAYGF